MQKTPTPSASPKWDALLLICRKCRKRGEGAGDVKPKTLAKIAHSLLKEHEPRPRVVLTGCLGVCPKAATTVAYLGGGIAPRVIAVASWEELDEALPKLLRGEG
jgi:predicted metal-binding protein